MAALDIICIGAINYDYMFHCTAEDLKTEDRYAGNEDLSNALSDVEADILELIKKNREYTTQIGGSAFITLKVVKHIFPGLKAAYTGVCGMPSEFDLTHGKTNDLSSELAHLDDRRWLFTTENRYDEPYSRAIAKSVVRLYNHTRNCIKIAPCANNTLLDRIRDQEEQTGESFAGYLAKARWVHLSSLSAFDQFLEITKDVLRAKELNPALKVSVDPGFEYTSLRRDALHQFLTHVDYIFLNNSEKKNLGRNAKRMRELYGNLREYFTASDDAPPCTLIVKHEDRHELLRFTKERTLVRTVRHKKLYQYELNNDTGAGDSFAGGFISGMLSDKLNADLAAPIQLGVLAAKGKMKSFDYENPYLKIQELAAEFMKAF